ncbi:FRIGIDA like 2 [Euphorbia peplus]|nr:FRIGIDA like 2 [Euphorbia peplus]
MASSNIPEIPTLRSIEAALNLIDTKKQNLKKAYDNLQSHSSLLSSFSISWSDLDSHFSSLQSSLTRRFLQLNGGHLSPSIQTELPPPSSLNVPIPNTSARPELVRMCENKDGKGLRNYFNEHPKERMTIREELATVMRDVPDAGGMVLDAMEGFFPVPGGRGDKDMELYHFRKSCLDLLEVLREIKVVVSDEVKEKAKIVAFEWKQKVSLNGDSPSEALGFMNLIVAFDLWWMFQVNEFLSYFLVIARFKQATDLCRAIGSPELTNEIIQKLIENEKHLLAVKFVLEFQLTEKFQPVPLLKDHLNECKKICKKIREEGKNSTRAKSEAKSREINALKAVLNIVEEHKLDSEYPRQELENQLEMVQKQKADKKVAAPSPNKKSRQLPKKQSQQQQSKKQRLNGNQRPHSSALNGLLPSAGSYGVIGSAPISSYSGASAGPYSMSGVALGYTVDPSPAGAHPYSTANPGRSGALPYSVGNPGPSASHQYSDPYVPTGYYDRSAAYGGYSLPPQYHPGHYPQ